MGLHRELVLQSLEGVTVRYGGTINTGNYENARIEAELTSSVPMEIPFNEFMEELWSIAAEQAQGQALAIRNKTAAKAKKNGGADTPEPPQEEPSPFRDPLPKTLGDIVTPKQLWMIRNLGREIGCNVEQECKSLTNANLEEISKRTASSFIDYLKRLQQEQQGPPPGAEGVEEGDHGWR